MELPNAWLMEVIARTLWSPVILQGEISRNKAVFMSWVLIEVTDRRYRSKGYSRKSIIPSKVEESLIFSEVVVSQDSHRGTLSVLPSLSNVMYM